MIHFNFRLIRKGDRYGRNDVLTHDKAEPVIEFYDPRYPHTALGQFVSSYYVSTFLGVNSGLMLHGGVPAWTMSPQQVIDVQATVREMMKEQAA
tara:strand:+ start:56 stop:337 length:282 start_codon:yes stop_codon:yes gene_type:complete